MVDANDGTLIYKDLLYGEVTHVLCAKCGLQVGVKWVAEPLEQVGDGDGEIKYTGKYLIGKNLVSKERIVMVLPSIC